MNAKILITLAIGVLIGIAQDRKAAETSPGILLLAHGGAANWNAEVAKLAADLSKTRTVEVAYGMANKRSMQEAIDRLVGRGVREIVAVPLFVSSHSSVITSTQYLLGIRSDAPPELAAYAGMNHDHSGHSSSAPAVDRTQPVKAPVPIRMTAALDAHPLVAEILLSRAREVSRDPAQETVVLVAHGPVTDDENAQWLSDMGSLAATMRSASSFHNIEYLTVRDDAPETVRSQATAELRAVVEHITQYGNRALVVPLLISYGGIETGIQKRLEGLSYTMSSRGLLPDDRLTRWVLWSAEAPGTAVAAARQ